MFQKAGTMKLGIFSFKIRLPSGLYYVPGLTRAFHVSTRNANTTHISMHTVFMVKDSGQRGIA